MYKLVSNIDGSRWSYLNGYNIFGNVVWLLGLGDIGKYTLIDADGNKIGIKNEDFLVEGEYYK